MLHAVPKTWKQQYHLGQKASPKMEYLQDTLEKIKIVCPVDDLGMQKNNERHSKKITSISEWISTRKTQIGGKFSLGGTISDKLTRLRAHCKQYEGAHNTHNTIECKMIK